MVEIQRKITPYNFTANRNKLNYYIVIHYVGSESTAKNNAYYFANNKVQASAHYFVDSTSIWQSVEDYNNAWHCGGGLQGSNGHSFYGKCKNSNSIGIEMCCFKDSTGRWFFTEQTVKNTIDLVKMLMKKHNIPIERVIRHYDVTGKNCPAPYINETEWQRFKDRILMNDEVLTMTQYEELKKEINALKEENKALKAIVGSLYKTEEEIPDYYMSTIKPLIEKGAIKGTGENLNLPEIIARTLVIINRDKSV